jgi:hypothetical protein
LTYTDTVLAEDFEYHPLLSDNFGLSLGAFRSNNAFKISAEGVIENETEDDIDFGDLGVDDKTTLFNGQLRWKFGKQRKWSLFGQYFDVNATGGSVVTEDVEFQDVIFREGTPVDAGVGMAISRLFIGRSFVKNQQHDFGIGIGLHNLDVSVFIEGAVLADDDTTEFLRGDARNSQPLPNIGIWYLVSPARKWLIHTRIDWISASIDDYSGTLWNTVVGVNYQAFRHIGFDLSFQYFNLKADVDSTDWSGGADLRYSGPVLAVTANW